MTKWKISRLVVALMLITLGLLFFVVFSYFGYLVTVPNTEPLKSGHACQDGLSPDFQLTSGYQALANNFNRGLQGRFPFVNEADPTFSLDANPEHILAIYRQLDELKSNSDITTLPPEARDFIRTLDQIRYLLTPKFNQNHSEAPSVLNFSVDFAVEPSESRGVENIVEHSFSVGDRIHVSPGKDLLARWHLGEPVMFEFTLANNLDWELTKYSGRSQPTIRAHRSARFRFTGTWSMFRMLRAHAMPRKLEMGNEYTLRFQALTKSKELTRKKTQEVVLFLRIRIITENAGETVKPVFPTKAPVCVKIDE